MRPLPVVFLASVFAAAIAPASLAAIDVESVDCKGEAAFFKDDTGVRAWIVRAGTNRDAYSGPGTDVPGFVFEVILPGGKGGSLVGPARSWMFIGPDPAELRDVTWNTDTALPWTSFSIRDNFGKRVVAEMTFAGCEPPPERK